VALLAPSALGLLPRLLVPQVVLAGYEINPGLFGQDAGRRAAAADSPQSGSPSRPVPTLTTRKPTASTWPVKDRSTTPHSPNRAHSAN
jgi:hypothetical protein